MYLENLVALHIAIEKHYTPEMTFKYLDKVLEGEIYCTTASNILKVLDYRKKSCANSSIQNS
ncbi:hypothetical protein [Clostridium botulinum]|uniref:hypothetical protein n=1 Tax=Clostridium botulinum TaxID=1491 RepID=UPI0004D435C6|nr:hypothetical protein [Clostridium botulinum]KEI01586.1 hypothetical protein Z952_12115 [Clostridium botulinum C/D str. BKT75002]KEI07920.1 hypothetical protein Z954_03250 [Clostridium botulinum C/D str. BKT2873]QPW61553.1 hypothetical protein IG390_05145 [Clostridium botulinum]